MRLPQHFPYAQTPSWGMFVPAGRCAPRAGAAPASSCALPASCRLSRVSVLVVTAAGVSYSALLRVWLDVRPIRHPARALAPSTAEKIVCPQEPVSPVNAPTCAWRLPPPIVRVWCVNDARHCFWKRASVACVIPRSVMMTSTVTRRTPRSVSNTATTPVHPSAPRPLVVNGLAPVALMLNVRAADT